MDELKKIVIRIPEVLSDGQVPPPPDELLDAMEEAGWTGDPGTGKAVLLADGSEVLNPTPMAPPVDYDTAPSAFDMWQMNLRRMANIRDLGGGFLIDETAEEADDYDVEDPEDVFVRSEYEFEMVPEVPSIGRQATPGPVTEVSPEEAKAAALRDLQRASDIVGDDAAK